MPKYIDFDALGVQSCNPDVFVNKGYAEGWNSLIKILHDAPAADVEPKQRWIPVTERLPEEGVYVLVYDGGIDVAKIEMGLSEGTRERMKKGELPDPIETGWCATGIVHYHRSEVYRECDEWGNNEAPYCWRVYANPATLFGQNVKYWMPLPEPPKGEENAKEQTT